MIAWTAWLVLLSTLMGSSPPCGSELFRVTRNTNANVVLYEARLRDGGQLEDEEPVRPVWLLLAEDGRREELNGLESALAYGIDARREERGGGFLVSLRARPETLIRVTVEAGCPVARTVIAGRLATLRLVDVRAAGGLLPRVEQIELRGVDVATGADVVERIVPQG